MCLIVLAINAIPDCRLVLLANRDEFHERPTRPSQWWNESPILAGRDQRAGGTWLGMTREGRLASVTNYREVPPIEGRQSRGEIPTRFLTGTESARYGACDLKSRGDCYSGFNALLYDGLEMAWVSNRAAQPTVLGHGIHGLSNHLLDTPWPKVCRLKEALRTSTNAHPDELMTLLADSSVAADEELPETGVGLDRERFLSPILIRGDGYGTRCSTVVTIDLDGQVNWVEVSLDRHGHTSDRRDYQWQIES